MHRKLSREAKGGVGAAGSLDSLDLEIEIGAAVAGTVILLFGHPVVGIAVVVAPWVVTWAGNVFYSKG